MREWTPAQLKRINRLRKRHKPFLKAREEFKDNPELGREHYQKHALVYKKKAELIEILEDRISGPRKKPQDGRVLRKDRRDGINRLIDDETITESTIAHRWNNKRLRQRGDK